LRLRERQIRNFAVILLVSQGVPMILAGDEARRTQRGNNNAYNQANEISWLDWDRMTANDPLRRFWKLLIDFRKRHPALRRDTFLDAGHVRWHGSLLDAPGWNDPSSRVLAFTLADVHVILNMDDAELDFQLPPGEWRRAFDTSLASPEDASDPGAEPAVGGGVYRAGGRSAVVLSSMATSPVQPV
jgi:glycogen operon protein